MESGKPPVKRSRFKEERERAKVHLYNNYFVIHVCLYMVQGRNIN